MCRTALFAAALSLIGGSALAQGAEQSLPNAILTNAFVGALKAATIAQAQIDALKKQVAELQKQNGGMLKEKAQLTKKAK